MKTSNPSNSGATQIFFDLSTDSLIPSITCLPLEFLIPLPLPRENCNLAATEEMLTVFPIITPP
ncbi:hypothetical protein TIFTF001_003165 [Ficus carica]|uniref:Uncharacterized protein n=1 Tax=Ficus carica TaxID=3494 RepID=A0AA88CUX3_FICCA|nr:hypothetical protein TIFTF001_003165 [Ficus carica]